MNSPSDSFTAHASRTVVRTRYIMLNIKLSDNVMYRNDV